jgi:hypothetical protein
LPLIELGIGRAECQPTGAFEYPLWVVDSVDRRNILEYTWMSVARVKRLWSAISKPRASDACWYSLRSASIAELQKKRHGIRQSIEAVLLQQFHRVINLSMLDWLSHSCFLLFAITTIAFRRLTWWLSSSKPPEIYEKIGALPLRRWSKKCRWMQRLIEHLSYAR